jgi:hypothetical protein
MLAVLDMLAVALATVAALACAFVEQPGRRASGVAAVRQAAHQQSAQPADHATRFGTDLDLRHDLDVAGCHLPQRGDERGLRRPDGLPLRVEALGPGKAQGLLRCRLSLADGPGARCLCAARCSDHVGLALSPGPRRLCIGRLDVDGHVGLGQLGLHIGHAALLL